MAQVSRETMPLPLIGYISKTKTESRREEETRGNTGNGQVADKPTTGTTACGLMRLEVSAEVAMKAQSS